MTKMNVVLYEPEIPQNTGNIARLCSCTNSKLYLVGKLGFSLADKYLKRSGMDYWETVDYEHVETLDKLIENNPEKNFYYLTTKSKNIYTNANFKDGDFLVFGPESRGIPEKILFSRPEQCLTIPMAEGRRSLNLSNSVAIVVYEAIRQLGL